MLPGAPGELQADLVEKAFEMDDPGAVALPVTQPHATPIGTAKYPGILASERMRPQMKFSVMNR